MSNFRYVPPVPTRPVLRRPPPVAQHGGLVFPAGPRFHRPAVKAAAPGVGLQGGKPAAESSDGLEVVYMSPSAAALSSSAAQGPLTGALLCEPDTGTRTAHSVVTSYIEPRLSTVGDPPASAQQHLPALQPAPAPPAFTGDHAEKPTAVVSPYESLPSAAGPTGAVLARPVSDSVAASPVPRAPTPRPPALSAAPWWDPAYRPGTLTRLSARGAAVTRQGQPQGLSGTQLGELVDRSRLMVGPYELVARDSQGNMISTQQLLREASINARSEDRVWTEAEPGPSSLQKSMDSLQECSPCDGKPRELNPCLQEPRDETYVQCESIVKPEPLSSALKLEPPTIIDAGVDYIAMPEQASQSPQVKQEYLSPSKVDASENTGSFQSSAARLNKFIKQEPGVSSLQVSTVVGASVKPEPAIDTASSPADSPESPADSEPEPPADSPAEPDSDPEGLPPGISLVNLHSLLNSEPGQTADGDTATSAETGAAADVRPPSQPRAAGKARRKTNWSSRKKGRKKIYRKPEGKGDGEIEPGNMVEVLFPNEDEPGESYDALDATVMKVDTAVRPTQYYVHFQDMPHRCDRWVVRTDISRIYRTQLKPISTGEPMESPWLSVPEAGTTPVNAASRDETVPGTTLPRVPPPTAAPHREGAPTSATSRHEKAPQTAVPPESTPETPISSKAAPETSVPRRVQKRKTSVPKEMPGTTLPRKGTPELAAARNGVPEIAETRKGAPVAFGPRKTASETAGTVKGTPGTTATRKGTTAAAAPSKGPLGTASVGAPQSVALRRKAAAQREVVAPSAAARRESARPNAKRRAADASRSPPPPSKRRAASPAARSAEWDSGRSDTPPPVLSPQVPPPRRKSYKPGPGKRKPGPKSAQRPVQPPRWAASDNAPGEGRVVHVIYETTYDGAKMLCPAKVMRVDTTLSYRRYQVRYLGWQRRFSEWVTDSVLHDLVENQPAPAGTGQLLRRCVLPPPGRAGGAAVAVYTRLRPCSVDLSRGNVFFLQVHRPLPHVVRDARVTALKAQLRPRMKDEYRSLTRW